MNITEQELVEALRVAMSAESDTEGAYTTAELCQMLGKGQKATQGLIRSMIASGQAECIKIRRQGIDGRSAVVPAYRFDLEAIPN